MIDEKKLREAAESWNTIVTRKSFEAIALWGYKQAKEEIDRLNRVNQSHCKLWNDCEDELAQVKTDRDRRIAAIREALGKIERAYPLDGDRMAHQDYAKEALAADDAAQRDEK